MQSVCLEIGVIKIHWYGVLMALGFLAGFVNWVILGRKRGYDLNFCSDLLFWIMVSGIVGARLAYVVANLRDYINNPIAIIRLDQGGLIYYGGLIGAALTIIVLARIKQRRLPALLDLVTTSLPLAHAFGRVGCFLNGCCHGIIHPGFPGVRYPAGSLPWLTQLHAGLIGAEATHSLPVHPVQLYESLYNLALYTLLITLYRRQPATGRITGLYLLLYPVGRFLLEFLRGGERMRMGNITVAQLISIGLFALGLGLTVWIKQRGFDSKHNG